MAFFRKALKLFWAQNEKTNFKRIIRQTPVGGVKSVCGLPYLNDRLKEHTLDVHYPENAAGALPVIIDIHGGGWLGGCKEINTNFCMSLASRGFCAFNLNYRLAGEYRFSDQIEDIFSAFRWVSENAADFPADIDKCFLAGDSAGGHLAFCAAVITASQELRRDFSIGEPLLNFSAVGAVSPAADLISPNIIMNINLPELLGKGYKKSKYYKYMDISRIAAYGMPPFYIVTSSGDFIRKHSYRMKETLDRLGIENEFHDFSGRYSGKRLPHVFSVLDPSPAYSRECLDEMTDFFKSKIKTAARQCD